MQDLGRGLRAEQQPGCRLSQWQVDPARNVYRVGQARLRRILVLCDDLDVEHAARGHLEDAGAVCVLYIRMQLEIVAGIAAVLTDDMDLQRLGQAQPKARLAV